MFPSTIYFIVTIFLHPHPLSSALDGSLCDGRYGEEVLCLMRHLCWANTTRPSSHVCHSYSKRNKTPRHSIHNRTIPYRPRNRCVELLLPLTHLYLVSLSRSEHEFRHDTHAKPVCSGSHYHRDNPL